ncbi:DbpA RNA binding domain-containing protein [Aliamphritea spongicola]|nr:DbpA RNA binding domain-containing protein [Aliamphritea spongicola]
MPSADMDVYRLDVGRNDGVQVKNIVGAIANEADINSRHIGDIRLNDDFSTVQLPKGMPAETLKHLQNVYICRKKTNITLFEGELPARAPRKPRSGNKPRHHDKSRPRRRDDRGE